jgi:hypothetical protein
MILQAGKIKEKIRARSGELNPTETILQMQGV